VTVTFEILGASKPVADLSHVFGYHTVGNINSFTPIFKDKSNSIFASTTVLNVGASTSTTIAANTSIAFAIFSSDGTKYSSENNQNTNLTDQVVVYELDSNVYLLAFEDIDYSQSDRDYNDLLPKQQ
jgi:amino acid permease